MPSRAIGLLVGALAVSIAAGACGSPATECGSGPCPSVPHRWTPHEIARDMSSNLFPPQANRRDHMYHTSCRITQSGTHAVCTGIRRYGPEAGTKVVAEGLLRENGSWDLLCWPRPSELCDQVEIREQRSHPITD
jgi:hypothetical protein